MRTGVVVALVSCAVSVGAGRADATTVPDDEVTLERLEALAASFAQAVAADRGDDVEAVACSVDGGQVSCYGRGDDVVIVGTTSSSDGPGPRWNLGEFVDPDALAATGPVAVIWESVIDPTRVNQPSGTQPTVEIEGVPVRVDAYGLVDAADEHSTAIDCQRAITMQQQNTDEPVASSCLFVQMR